MPCGVGAARRARDVRRPRDPNPRNVRVTAERVALIDWDEAHVDAPDLDHYLLFTVDLHVVFRVEEASDERPYFGMRLDLDPSLVASVMMEAGAETRKGDAGVKAIGVNPVDADLLD